MESERLKDTADQKDGWWAEFRIHDQEIGRRRHLLREFQLRRREKFL